MDKKTQAFHAEVKEMQRRLNSYFDAPDSSDARGIAESIRQLEVELHTGKTGDSIQNRLKDIERRLKPAFDDNVMSYNHFIELETWVRGHLNNFQ
jgi:hypothetical protein